MKDVAVAEIKSFTMVLYLIKMTDSHLAMLSRSYQLGHLGVG